jgi:hypothetical protein
MRRARHLWIAAIAMVATLSTGMAFGQTPTPPPAARGQGRAGRAGLPAIQPNMNQQQLQTYIDAWALIQAQTALKLSDEQVPNFIARLQRLQQVRRRHMAERRRIMGELNLLLNASPAAAGEDIDAHVKALGDADDTQAADLKKAYLDLDAVLTPWQRGRFRQFEEQVERKKIELLAKIGPPVGPPVGQPNAPAPGRGRF